MRRALSAVAVVVCVAGAVVVSQVGGSVQVLEEPDAGCLAVADPLAADVLTGAVSDFSDAELLTSQLGALVDGGVVAYLVVDLDQDGGPPYSVVLDHPPCVRRLPGSAVGTCSRQVPGFAPQDMGDGTRFLERYVVDDGGCQRVACSVMAGECVQ